MILRSFSNQLQRIRGDGFVKEAVVFNSRSEASYDKRIQLPEFQRLMMNFNLNRDFVSEEASDYQMSTSRNERFATPDLDL